jgi:hypothetical protein
MFGRITLTSLPRRYSTSQHTVVLDTSSHECCNQVPVVQVGQMGKVPAPVPLPLPAGTVNKSAEEREQGVVYHEPQHEAKDTGVQRADA